MPQRVEPSSEIHGYRDGEVAPEDRYARLVASRLRFGMESKGASIGKIAERTCLSRSTVHAALHMRGYIDLRTLARIEVGTRISLLPHFHERAKAWRGPNVIWGAESDRMT